MAKRCWGWGWSPELWLQEVMPSRRERVPLELSPARAWGNASSCKPELLFAHSTTGLLVVTEVRQGGWERNLLRSGKGQNQSLGKNSLGWSGQRRAQMSPGAVGDTQGNVPFSLQGSQTEHSLCPRSMGTEPLQDGTQERESLWPQRPPPAPHTPPLLLKNGPSGPHSMRTGGSEQPLCQRGVTASPAPRRWCIPALI